MRDSQINVDRERLRVAPSLELAVTWRREVRAGIERIWENVFDWEHLPVLHEMYFNAVEQIEIGDWGWRVALTKNPGTPDRSMVLEMRADREKARYRVQTLSGDGAGTEIWTLLTPLAPHRTAVEVRYYLPERRPERLAALADKYRASCARLWNEDEAMMMRREEMMTRASAERRRSEKPVPLGPSAGLRRRLPLLVEYEGEPFRIVEGEEASSPMPRSARIGLDRSTRPHRRTGSCAARGTDTALTCAAARAPTGAVTGWRRPARYGRPVTGEASLVPCGRPIFGSSTVNKPSSGRKAQI